MIRWACRSELRRTAGEDVVISDRRDHRRARAAPGSGWTMLMECLADGRGISLPAEAPAASKHAARVASAYASHARAVRRRRSGEFEGDRRARWRGWATSSLCLMDSLRRFLCGALGAGLQAAGRDRDREVELTELGAHGDQRRRWTSWAAPASCSGRATCSRTRYIGAPIGITVEGANIMTRDADHLRPRRAPLAIPFALRESTPRNTATSPPSTARSGATCGHVVAMRLPRAASRR